VITHDHPYFFLAKLYQNEDAIFHLSKYKYVADSLFDEREFISVRATELTESWLESAINSLDPEYELALHSKVLIRNRTYHIPMIDFSISGSFTTEAVNRMRYFLPKNVMLNMEIYDSGRSFHAYSTTLIQPKKWIEFMGRLLLINSRKDQHIVDTRWVGHRLIGGFSSLRWSNNTNQYLGLPRRIPFPT